MSKPSSDKISELTSVSFVRKVRRDLKGKTDDLFPVSTDVR